VKPAQPLGGRSQSAARVDGGDHGHASIQLEDALERTNLQRALHRVERNGGAPGIDGMTTAELRPYLRTNWPAIARALLVGSYRPSPVRRVEIPKPGGGTRPLGIPTVLDRFLQQALLQALQPSFERIFAEQSYGFRPKRSAHQAVKAAQALVREGYGYVVDLDIAKFFDRVNHDLLMGRVAQRIKDPRILLLVRRYLESGILVDGLKVRTVEGTPQGGPLSPLLANILLHDLDTELARRGHRFVRYADDCNVYVRSRRAGERVMAGLRRFLATRLKLQVNEAKSAVDRATARPFLGFAFLGDETARVRLDPESLRRVKARIRTLTKRSQSIAMAERIARLNRYLLGWVAYFSLAETPSSFEELDGWLRRRMRQCRWKEWKWGPTRKRNLLRLGLDARSARAGQSRKGSWRMAGSPILSRTLDRRYWQNEGLVSIAGRYALFRHA
jgi:group II intron reverse transcriptase/maturase